MTRYLFDKDYHADPSAKVFNGRLYIYPSHDRVTDHVQDDDGGHFQMRDYHVFSTDDIENGELIDHGCVLDQDQVAWAEKQMWDNDVIEKDGKYYMVFSAKDYNGVFHLGAAVADKPEGPFIPNPNPIRGSYSIDPCLFKDDDGEIYCYFGGIWGGQLQWYKDNRLCPDRIHLPIGTEHPLPSRVARLVIDGDDVQFAEAPKPVILFDQNGEMIMAEDPRHFFEASWMAKKDGKYLFSYSTGDTHLMCLAEGDNPYGPFTFKEVLLQPVVGWTTHGSMTEFKGKWYIFHHDSVPSGGKTWLRSLKVKEW